VNRFKQYRKLDDYLLALLSFGFVRRITVRGRFKQYCLTSSGFNFLQSIENDIELLLRDKSLITQSA
jgi:predicted transcriptional regulator